MTLFIVVASLMTLASWWLVVRPLLRKPVPAPSPADALRQQIAQLDALHQSGALPAEHHRDSRAALERKLFETSGADAAAPAGRPYGLLVMVALLLAGVTAGGYRLVGTPAALGPLAEQARQAGAQDHSMTLEKIATLADTLAARLKDNPNDAQGWGMLARSNVVLGRYPEAAAAFKRAVALVKDDAQLYADYADALAMANDRSLSGEPMQLVAQALKLDPNNLKALTLAGTDAFERQDYATAVKDWEKVAQLASDDTEFVQQVRASVAEARALAAKAGIKLPPPAAGMAAPGGISGRVSLAPALAKRAAPDDTVFVFARAAEGPRMPLAILRKQVKDLPFEFTLDDSTAMSPQMKLSNFAQVVVGARISKSGNAMPQPGDLQGQTAPVGLGATGLKIEIGEVVP